MNFLPSFFGVKSGSRGGLKGFASPAGKFLFSIAPLAFGFVGLPDDPLRGFESVSENKIKMGAPFGTPICYCFGSPTFPRY